MCSKEDVLKIVADSERRMEQYVESKLYEQQVQLSKTVSNLLGSIQKDLSEIKEFAAKFDNLDAQELEEITTFKNGISTAKNILVGLAIFVGSIGAIATGFIALIKSIK